MSSKSTRPATLLQTYEDLAASIAVPLPCPSPTTLWDTLTCTAPPSTRRHVADHLATCESCSRYYNLAKRLGAKPATRWGRMVERVRRVLGRRRGEVIQQRDEEATT